MAQAAGVHRLVLTHYAERATARDLDESARQFFAGDIVVADDHHILDVGAVGDDTPGADDHFDSRANHIRDLVAPGEYIRDATSGERRTIPSQGER
jgi:hypothetical protein